MRVTTDHRDGTHAVGRAVGGLCRVGDVVALDGVLGAGKTQFVRGLAEGLGLDPRQVSSPTFVFVQEYLPEDTGSGRPILVHVDAYRLRDAGELDTLGWDDELLDGAVLAVEWAERIMDRLGPDRLQVTLGHAGEQRRDLELFPHGGWVPRMPALQERIARCVTGSSPPNPTRPTRR